MNRIIMMSKRCMDFFFFLVCNEVWFWFNVWNGVFFKVLDILILDMISIKDGRINSNIKLIIINLRWILNELLEIMYVYIVFVVFFLIIFFWLVDIEGDYGVYIKEKGIL